MFPEKQCPLCDGKASVYLPNGIDARIECSRCGRFKVTRVLYTTVLRHKNSDAEVQGLLPYVSAYTRQASERGEEIFLENSNWKDFALAHKSTPISRKTTKLLELIAARSTYGHRAQLDSTNDLPLVGRQRFSGIQLSTQPSDRA
jgi:hypothetical protein